MNGKTAKVLRRAAASLALLNVSRAEVEKPPRKRMQPREKVVVIRATSRKIYKTLRADWKATPRPQRAKFRHQLQAITARTKAELKKVAA